MACVIVNILKIRESNFCKPFHHLALKCSKISNSWAALKFVKTSNFQQQYQPGYCVIGGNAKVVPNNGIAPS